MRISISNGVSLRSTVWTRLFGRELIRTLSRNLWSAGLLNHSISGSILGKNFPCRDIPSRSKGLTITITDLRTESVRTSAISTCLITERVWRMAGLKAGGLVSGLAVILPKKFVTLEHTPHDRSPVTATKNGNKNISVGGGYCQIQFRLYLSRPRLADSVFVR